MKKIVALLLVLVMAFGLVACGGSIGEAKVAGQNKYPDARYDDAAFGSDEWDGAMPIVTDNQVLTVGLGASPNTLDYDTNAYTVWLEETTGFDIQFQLFSGSGADYATQVGLMMTGNEPLPDIFIDASGALTEHGDEGALQNIAGYLQHQAYYTVQTLNDYFPDPAERAQVEKNFISSLRSTVTGAIYEMPHMYGNKNDTILAQTVINVEWLEKVGKEMPTTIEELYDVLVAFRDEDPNGNGKSDEIPMFGRNTEVTQDIVSWIVNAFTLWHPSYKVAVDDNGKVYAPFMTEEYREAMKFLNKLVDENLLSDMTFTATFADIAAVLNPAPGKDYTVGITAAMTDSNFNVGGDSIYDYEPLAPLKDATGKGGYAPTWIYKLMKGNVITRDCENVEAAFRFCDFLNSHDSYVRCRYGKEGVNWVYCTEEEGKGKGNFGGDAKIKIIDPVDMGLPHNQFWSRSACLTNEQYWQILIDGSDPWMEEMYEDLGQQIEYVNTAGVPDNYFQLYDRTEEEQEIFQEYSSELNDLLWTSTAEFACGIRDPYDDDDWDDYLQDFKKLHVQECWIDIAQATVDRQNAK